MISISSLKSFITLCQTDAANPVGVQREEEEEKILNIFPEERYKDQLAAVSVLGEIFFSPQWIDCSFSSLKDFFFVCKVFTSHSLAPPPFCSCLMRLTLLPHLLFADRNGKIASLIIGSAVHLLHPFLAF